MASSDAPNPAPLLRLTKVAKFYGDKLVFKGVDLDLSRGETLLVLGRNGAGKSTLLKVMSGLVRPTAGQVDNLADAARQAYLGHATFLYAGLTARANLAFWARMYGTRLNDDQLDELLDRVGLRRAAEEKAGTFSRGMAQRLSLARLFLMRPELLFLDEPDTGLDAPSRQLLARELSAMKEQGAALVWVSHRLESDRDLADRVLELTPDRGFRLEAAASYVPGGAGEGAMEERC